LTFSLSDPSDSLNQPSNRGMPIGDSETDVAQQEEIWPVPIRPTVIIREI